MLNVEYMAHALLENVTDDTIAQPLCDKIYDHFPLFDETLCNIELCNSVITDKYSEKSAKTSLTVCHRATLLENQSIFTAVYD